MGDSTSGSGLSNFRLILVPAIISLVVTVLRLVGEMQHWPSVLFKTEAGGFGAIVGIAWLPLIFGPYFALKLTDAGMVSRGAGKTIGMVFLGIVVFVGGGFFLGAPMLTFPGHEIIGVLLIGAAALVPLVAWPALTKTLIAYGYTARIPVAILMYFALRGHWGTHYDALPPNYAGPTDFLGMYVLIALVPQLIAWIAYTVLLGGLAGAITTAIARRGSAAQQATS
jgi:hypothetical protein